MFKFIKKLWNKICSFFSCKKIEKKEIIQIKILPWAPAGSPTIIARSLASDRKQDQCEIYVAVQNTNRFLNDAFYLIEQANLNSLVTQKIILRDTTRAQIIQDSIARFHLIVYQLQEQVYKLDAALKECTPETLKNNDNTTCNLTHYSV